MGRAWPSRHPRRAAAQETASSRPQAVQRASQGTSAARAWKRAPRTPWKGKSRECVPYSASSTASGRATLPSPAPAPGPQHGQGQGDVEHGLAEDGEVGQQGSLRARGRPRASPAASQRPNVGAWSKRKRSSYAVSQRAPPAPGGAGAAPGEYGPQDQGAGREGRPGQHQGHPRQAPASGPQIRSPGGGRGRPAGAPPGSSRPSARTPWASPARARRRRGSTARRARCSRRRASPSAGARGPRRPARGSLRRRGRRG